MHRNRRNVARLAAMLATVALTVGAGAGTALAHSTSGIPLHQDSGAAVCAELSSGGHIAVGFPFAVYAFNRTAGVDSEYVYWRGYVERWDGSRWVRYLNGSMWRRALANDRDGIISTTSAWVKDDEFWYLPSGYYRAGHDIYWSSRGIYHSTPLPLEQLHYTAVFTDTVPYCTFPSPQTGGLVFT
jgi:hypothetical protein